MTTKWPGRDGHGRHRPTAASAPGPTGPRPSRLPPGGVGVGDVRATGAAPVAAGAADVPTAASSHVRAEVAASLRRRRRPRAPSCGGTEAGWGAADPVDDHPRAPGRRDRRSAKSTPAGIRDAALADRVQTLSAADGLHERVRPGPSPGGRPRSPVGLGRRVEDLEGRRRPRSRRPIGGTPSRSRSADRPPSGARAPTGTPPVDDPRAGRPPPARSGPTTVVATALVVLDVGGHRFHDRAGRG